MNAATQSATAVAELLYPSYWLVSGLEWHGDEPTAEAAAVVAPAVIRRHALSYHAFQVLGCADLYARKHGHRVVFFSDLTRMLAKVGMSWTKLGVEFQNALRELNGGPFSAVFLTISQRMHMTICDPANSQPADTHSERGGTSSADRELARQAIARQVASDWPAYTQQLIDTGRVSLTR